MSEFGGYGTEEWEIKWKILDSQGVFSLGGLTFTRDLGRFIIVPLLLLVTVVCFLSCRTLSFSKGWSKEEVFEVERRLTKTRDFHRVSAQDSSFCVKGSNKVDNGNVLFGLVCIFTLLSFLWRNLMEQRFFHFYCWSYKGFLHETISRCRP